MLAPFLLLSQPPEPAELRAVLDSVFADPAYAWRQEADPMRWLLVAWNALTGWLTSFREDNPVLYQWFLFGLIVVLVVIVVHASWTLVHTLRQKPARARGAAPAPRPAPKDARWYSRRAEEAAANGQFTRALQMGFHALILQLDRRGIVGYRAAKTPGEYVADSALGPVDRERLQKLVGELYRFVFGGEPCTAQDYEAWRALAAEAWHAAPP